MVSVMLLRRSLFVLPTYGLSFSYLVPAKQLLASRLSSVPLRSLPYQIPPVSAKRLFSSEPDKMEEPVESDDIRFRKQVLRKEIRAKVRALSPEELSAQSEKVWEKLFQLPEYQNAKTVGLFLSMPKNEIKTETVLRHCVENSKTIYVPEVGQNFECADMELLRVFAEKNESGQLFYESWPKNKWGIPEPPESMTKEVAKPGDIDLLVVPGLGFDRQGNRIGQGKGYYDRFITRITKDAKPKLVAVTLLCQLVDAIPVSPLDRVMDKIVLPSEIIEITKT